MEDIKNRLERLYFDKIRREPSYSIPQRIKVNNSQIKAVGIDLGTSRCCAAVNRKSGMDVVAIDSTGERQLPSYISFDEEREKCGQVVVNRLQNFAKSTVFDSKRIIGRNFDEVQIDKSWPFQIINVENKPLIKVYGPDAILEKHSEEIAAVLLKQIKEKTEEFQVTKLDEVVITVPAAFNKYQKLATHVAAELAGWKTVYLLPEPVAASIAYFVKQQIVKNTHFLLFDLGGGTLDVCFFKVLNKRLEIISHNGDTNLGGRDFDKVLISHFSNILKNIYGIEVNEAERLKYKLMQKCMEIKHALSSDTTATLCVDDFSLNNEEFVEITRTDFEELSSRLLKKIEKVIHKTFFIADLKKSEIKKILLVGGGCRMPMIKKLLQNTFTDAELCCEEQPDQIVAIGAAYYAYSLYMNDCLNDEIMVTVNTKNVIKFDENLSLPIEKKAVIAINKNDDTLQVAALVIIDSKMIFFEKIKVTTEMIKCENVIITFTIDKNKACSLNYSITPFVKNIRFRLENLYVKKNDLRWYNGFLKVRTNDVSITAVGIDFGTTQCFAAVNRRNGIKSISLNNAGERQFPSYVAFDEEKTKCGKAALDRLQNNSRYTVFDLKRIIGRRFHDIKIDKNWPFEVFNVGDKPMIRVQGPNGILEKCPEEIVAVLLKHIKKKVKELQGKEINHVVITVPATFTIEQKLAIHVAAELAGWEMVRFLPESIAASIAYFVYQPVPNEFTLLLFYLSSRTLDISILKNANGNFSIISNRRDENIERNINSLRHMDSIKEVLIRTLSDVNYPSMNINKVLLVGGACRLPMIKQLLLEMFQKAEHCCDENPDETIALGAAYYAYNLDSQKN